MHKNLKRQIARYLGDGYKIPNEMEEFFESISKTYESFDEDHALLERSMEISSQEIVAKNKQYSSLFEHMVAGFALHEMVYDPEGVPIDYIFREINPAFEQITNLKKADIVGRKVTDVLPGIADDPTNWIQKYGEVAKTGKPVTFESFSKELNRWYLISAYSPKKDYFVAIFSDITEKKFSDEQTLKHAQDLEKLNKVMINRELKMIELKKELNELKDKGKE